MYNIGGERGKYKMLTDRLAISSIVKSNVNTKEYLFIIARNFEVCRGVRLVCREKVKIRPGYREI